MNTVCRECGRAVTSQGRRGPTKRLCSATCRKRASRRRQRERVVFPPAMTSRTAWTRAAGARPVTVSGAFASVSNPKTWAAFSDVQDGAGDGYGVMLGDGLGAYVLDGALGDDGRALPWARAVLAEIVEPVLFREVSPSGRGLHVFVSAGESPGARRLVDGGGIVERFSRRRFIRTTGIVYERG